MKFILYGEFTDLNTYIKALNSNRHVGNKIKQNETDRVAWDIKKMRFEKITKYPVHISYNWYSKNKKKDTDNVAFSKKFLNDGFVISGLLENDSRKFISGFSDYFFIDPLNPRVEVEII